MLLHVKCTAERQGDRIRCELVRLMQPGASPPAALQAERAGGELSRCSALLLSTLKVISCGEHQQGAQLRSSAAAKGHHGVQY